MQYSVKLDAFEGPLDLLLHLINRFEVDIYNIPMAELTEQYLLYIYAMQELKLDDASEYLVMAATLIEIKSKMLLPKQDENLFDDNDLDIEIEEDPREELMKRLIEYRKYKEAAQDFKQLEEDRGQMFTRAPSDLSEYSQKVSEKVELEVSLYDMLGAFQKLLRRKKLQKPMQTKITRQEIPIDVRMDQILHELVSLKPNERKNFIDLFPFEDKGHIVVTFLAILELMKKNTIMIQQENNFSDIFLSVRT